MSEIADILQTVGPQMRKLSEEFRDVSMAVENMAKELRILNQSINSMIALEDERTDIGIARTQ